MKENLFSKENLHYLFGAIIVLSLICFLILYFSEAQIPTVFSSSGLIAIISAIIGVLLTVLVTNILLGRQTENQNDLMKKQSEIESQKDKDAKIFKQKILVYSDFTEKMWMMLDDIDDDNDVIVINNKLKELRNICFRKLVFYLNDEQINQIYKQINSIDITNNDTVMRAVGGIALILKNSLNEENSLNKEESVKYGGLITLFNAFTKKNVLQENQENLVSNNTQQSKETFWHFNVLGEEQITAFKDGKMFLSLIEYGEEWRTNLVKQVKPNDVIFLFKRGGTGYIGAFKALDRDPPSKVIRSEN
jgi:hypothetical protein